MLALWSSILLRRIAKNVVGVWAETITRKGISWLTIFLCHFSLICIFTINIFQWAHFCNGKQRFLTETALYKTPFMLSERTKQNGGKATAWPSWDEDGTVAEPNQKEKRMFQMHNYAIFFRAIDNFAIFPIFHWMVAKLNLIVLRNYLIKTHGTLKCFFL